jgi:hypothetical protein
MTQKKIVPMDKKGVSTEMHYQCLTPRHFVTPLLHMETGMVNQVWDDLENWIDDAVEIIPLQEKDARKNLKDAIKNFESAKAEKMESEKTTNIEIREKNAEVKTLKSAL